MGYFVVDGILNFTSTAPTDPICMYREDGSYFLLELIDGVIQVNPGGTEEDNPGFTDAADDTYTYYPAVALDDTLRLLQRLTEPDTGIGGASSGDIILQENVWQLIAINVKGVRVKEYFLDRLEAITGVPSTNLVKVVNAYPGHLNQFLGFVPGLTNPLTDSNFYLVTNDNGTDEITAFWVKMLDYKQYYPQDIVYTWNSLDGIE